MHSCVAGVPTFTHHSLAFRSRCMPSRACVQLPHEATRERGKISLRTDEAI